VAPAPRADASLAELVGELTRETGLLVRQEVQLASTEMGEKARGAARDAGVVLAGAAVAHAGLVVVMIAFALAAAAWIPFWLSALLIGSVAVVGGAALASAGLASLRRLDPVPVQAVEALRSDKAWLKEQLR